MDEDEIPAINFTISPSCVEFLKQSTEEYNSRYADPIAALGISWGTFQPNDPSKPSFDGVFIGVYPKSMLPEIAHGIRSLCGIDVVFFTLPKHAVHFAGKVLDHSEERGFFLREP